MAHNTMKSKPNGAKYRNLYARAGVIYYERVANGRRIKLSTKTGDWGEAAAFRDLYEERKRIGSPVPFLEVPRFDAFAGRYLREATAHLAATTKEDRNLLLRGGGILTAYFGALPLDEVSRPLLLEWWHAEVEGRGRSERTGLAYLSALSGVLGYAVDLELIPANPVDTLRATLRRRRRSKKGRAARADAIRPIESRGELRAFVAVSGQAYALRFANGRPRRERRAGHVADLLQLDAGLRFGEVAGLRWRDVHWGADADDTSRALEIRESKARGKHEGAPKSGRARRVPLSRRLRRLLREFWVAEGQPPPEARVLPKIRQRNYQGRHFAEVCKAASLTGHTPKDLRDTFASQLLTCGVSLGWISRALGHSGVAVTSEHYARWCSDGEGAYREPLRLEPGEVPPDLLARITVESHQKSHQRTGSDA